MPDTLDGRFAVLATVAALAHRPARAARRCRDALSVALTERFIEVMEAEHRELGLGDPTLGKTVRKLVGSLARADRAVARGDRGRRRLARCRGAKPLSRSHRPTAALAPCDGGAEGTIGRGSSAATLAALAEGRIRMIDSFAHHLRLDQIRDGERIDLVRRRSRTHGDLRAARAEAVDRLDAHATLSRNGDVVRAAGPARRVARSRAASITRDPVAAHIDEPFELMFMPEPPAAGPTKRSSLARAIATWFFTTAARSTSAAPSPTRSRSASTLIRGAPAPMPRSRKPA